MASRPSSHNIPARSKSGPGTPRTAIKTTRPRKRAVSISSGDDVVEARSSTPSSSGSTAKPQVRDDDSDIELLESVPSREDTALSTATASTASTRPTPPRGAFKSPQLPRRPLEVKRNDGLQKRPMTSTPRVPAAGEAGPSRAAKRKKSVTIDIPDSSEEEEKEDDDDELPDLPVASSSRGKSTVVQDKGKGRAVQQDEPAPRARRGVVQPERESSGESEPESQQQREQSSGSDDDAAVAKSLQRQRRSRSTTRSHSSRGYTWEVERLHMSPQDLLRRLTYEDSTETTITRPKFEEKVTFNKGDRVWILPDTKDLTPQSHEVDIMHLPDENWWAGKILNVCSYAQDEGDPMCVLRVQWYYDADYCCDLKSLHKSLKERIRKYRFDERELILSDHVDFVGVETFAGKAAVHHYLTLRGLEVPDKESLKPVHLRKKVEAPPSYNILGFTLKKKDTRRQRAKSAEREARS